MSINMLQLLPISRIQKEHLLRPRLSFRPPQLLDLVGGWAGTDDAVVMLAAPALAAILREAPTLTAATFVKFDVLAVLAAAATKQEDAEARQVSHRRRGTHTSTS